MFGLIVKPNDQYNAYGSGFALVYRNLLQWRHMMSQTPAGELFV